MVEKKAISRVELRNARITCGLSQAELARLVGVGVKEVERWEHGEVTPFPHYRLLLAKQLGITVEELEALLTQSPCNHKISSNRLTDDG